MPEREKGFKLYDKDEPAYLQAPVFAAGGYIDHAFSTRLGGCSKGAFASLNTGFHTGDCQESVLENRRRFFGLFGYDYRSIVSSIQVHGTGLHVFDGTESGEGALPDTARRQVDALVTERPDLPLTAYSADCLLIYFATKQSKPLVALAHAGWRGTLGGIGSKVVCYLQENFTADPEQLLVGLSPAICKRCYKIDDQVAGQFQSVGWEDPSYIEPVEEGGWIIDLPAINAQQLLQAGVRAENMVYNYWCTSCHPELFYSYRREKGPTGRMLGFIAISNFFK